MAGRSTWGGTGRYSLTMALRPVVVVLRCDEGTRRCRLSTGGPAVPPSLATAGTPGIALSMCAAAGSTCAPSRRALFRQLGVDLRSGQHPRARTVPGSLSAVLGATRPVHAVRRRPVCQSLGDGLHAISAR